MESEVRMRNKIMVIDDDRDFLSEVSETLSLSDYDVVTVADPTAALDKIIESRPDLILLDIKMPEESGFQVASKIRYFSGLRQIPIIAVTGSLSEHHRKVINGYGISGCLIKPVDPIELVSKIEESL